MNKIYYSGCLVVILPKFQMRVFLSVLVLITLLTSSPVNGQIVSFSENFVSSDSDSDGTTYGDPSGSLSNTNAQDGSNYVISEENKGKRTTYFKEITIDNTQVTADLTNFPVLISLIDTDLKQHAQPDGDDILFYNDQGKKLSHEIEVYDPNYSGTEAQLVAWVKANLSSTVDTTLTMRYGHSERVNEQDPIGVWDSNYKGVWHLNNDPSISAPQVTDSTINDNDGTSFGSMTNSDLVTGKIGSAINFDGSNDYINIGNDVSVRITGAITIEAWFNAEVDVDNDYIVSKGGLSGNRGWDLSLDPDTGTAGWVMFRFYDSAQSAYSEGFESVDINNWYHIAGVFDPNTAELFYLNGALVSQDLVGVPSSLYDNVADMMIALREGATNYFDGTIDEVRLSNVARSTEWIATQYNNQNNPSSFYTVSNQLKTDGWQSYKEISIDPSNFDSDLDGFPYLLELYDADLKNYAQADGDDIAFFTSSDEKLPHEIETYNPSYNSTHAKLTTWIKIDASATKDTKIVMKYNDPDLPSQENPTAVWDANHAGVWHLEEDPSGTAPQMLDSTNNLHHGTTTNSPLTVTGQILQGLEFTDPASPQHVSVSHTSSLSLPNTLSISLWINPDVINEWQVMVSKMSVGNSHDADLYYALDNTGAVVIEMTSGGGGTLYWDTNYVLSTNTWYHVAFTFDGPTQTGRMYVDGVEIGSNNFGVSTLFTNSNPLYFGYNTEWTDEMWDGEMDEIHISNNVRSADWLKALYTNQLNPVSTYSISESYQKAEWEFYKDIYIDSTNINSDLTDFPVMIALNDSDLKTKAMSNGQDIAFYSDQGTKLSHELVEYNNALNSTHAYLLAWVETDLYQSTDTRIEIRYGNTTTLPDQSSSRETWSGYNSVWHLEEDPSSAAPQIIDSRGSNYGTSGGSMTTTDLVEGHINNGLDFDGVDDRVTVGDIDMDDWSSVSLSLWFKYTSAGGQYIKIFSSEDTTSHLDATLSISLNDAYADSRQITVRIGTDGVGGSDGSVLSTAENTFGLNEWVHIGVTWDSSTERIKLYVNGAELINSFKDGDSLQPSTREVVIGNTAVTSTERPFPGIVDEVKLSQIAYIEDWFDAEYANHLNPTSFYSTSGEKDYRFYDYIDEETSTDTKSNLGTVSQFGDMRATDDQVTLLTETTGTTNSYAFGTPGTGSMVVGEGSVNWNSPAGTIGFWIYENNVPSTTERPWGQDDNMELRYDAGMSLSADFGTVGFFSNVYTFSTGTWYYVAITWDENTDLISLYIATESTFPVYSNTTTWTYSLAGQTGGLNQFMNSRFTSNYVDGYGDELRYYDSYLTESEIEYYHNRTIYGNEDNLVSYFNFDNQNYDDIGPANSDGNTQGSGHTFSSSIKPSIQQGDSFFDWEAKFTDIPFTEVGVTLAIKTGVWGSEDLELQYWSGSDWTTLTSSFSSNSWYNVSINDFVLSSFTIRFYDLNRTNDQLTNVWRIDSILLYYEDFAVDWEQTISGIDTAREYYDLAVYGGSNSTDETYFLQLWDSGLADWTSSYFTIDDTGTWYNSSLDPTDITSSMIVRYTDSDRSQDYLPSSLNLDYLSIDSYDRNPEFSFTPSNQVYVEGTTGHSISWTVSDLNPDTYVVYVDDAPGSPIAWTNGTINYNIDGLEAGVHNITIVVNDGFTGQVVDEVTVTVNDETAPVIDPSNNFEMSEGDLGKTLNWTATDLHAGSYIIYRNDSNVASTTWTSGVNISISLDGEVKGVWNYTILVQDESGNDATNTIFVTVYDTTDPTINSPPDQNYDEDSNGNTVEWTAIDNYPDYYVIYQNGSQVTTGNWVSSTPISWGIDGLSVGNYNFTIIVFDSSGNFVKDVILVFSRDTTNPGVTSPNDFSYEEGSTGNSITWSLSDTNPFTYTIYRDGFQLFTASWTNGDISISVNGLDYGQHNFTIVVRDQYGHSVTDTVLIDVTDTVAPTFSTPPVNTTMSEGSSDNIVSWIASDNNPDTYTYYLNGSSSGDIWESGIEEIYNIDSLTKGIYNYTVVISDLAGNTAQIEIWITVLDTTNPTITQPPNITYEHGSSGNIITWTPTDTYANTYVVYLDGVVFVSNSTWISGDPIVVSINGLDVGTNYNFTIVVSDDSGNIRKDMVLVSVIDTTDPLINSPSDKLYYEDQTPKTVEWTATDLDAATYTITRNGVQVFSGAWTSGVEIQYNFDSLGIGSYTFVITVYDASGNSVSDTILVDIQDRINPSIDQPANVTYSEGSTGNSITWTISDNHPSELTIYRNGSVIQSGSWTSGTTFVSIDGLSLGNYNFTVFLNDTSGNFAIDTAWVFVIDDTVPVVSDEGNQIISEFSTGNKITWVASDLNPDYYIVYVNDVPGSQIAWESGNSLIYNLDSLAIGSYNITIQVFDSSGNYATDQVDVTVEDQTNPTLTHPVDITYEYGSTGNQISWTPTDAHDANYTIYLDGSVNTTNVWTSGVPVIQDIDGLAVGTYNFTIYIQDESGNTAVDTVIVIVEDNIIPQFTEETADFQYNEETTSNILSWTVTDLLPNTYRVYQNGVIVLTSTSWQSGVQVTYNVDGLLLGVYNYTVVFRDTSGNLVSSSTIITVVDQNSPSITPQPDDNYSEDSTGNSISWPVSDTHPSQMTIYRNGTVILSNSWTSGTISINIDGLLPNVYNYTIVLTDSSGNSAQDTVFITVEDTTLPVINPPSDFIVPEDELGNVVAWIITDKNPSNYTIYRNGTQIKTGDWISGGNTTASLNGLTAGPYNFTIIAQDEAGNLVVDTVIVTVTAESVFVSVPDDVDYVVGTPGNTIEWIVTDVDEDKYIIYQNGSEVDSGSWVDNQPITWNIDGLSIGAYNFSIYINDTNGNYITDQMIVVVSDMPVWDEPRPVDVTYSEGDPASIVWNATDQFPDSWVVYKNGSFYASGTGWTNASAITVDISGLSLGVHEFTIYVNDTSNNTIFDTVFITIEDNEFPLDTDLQSDYTTSEVSTGNTISWTFTDLHAANYTILISTGGPNSTYAFGDWTSGVPITYNIDDLTKGVYTFYILVQDTSGNTVQFSAVITIQDQTSPVISNSNINNNSTIITEVSTDNWLNVTAVDTYADTVTIYHNISGSIEIYVLDATWNSGIATNHSLEIYTIGVYIIIFEFTDVSGNAINQSYIITVIDATNPVIEDEPDVPDYGEESTGNSITWTTTETNRDYYVIYLDDVVDVNTTWTGDITYNIDGLAYGTHNVTIIVYDTSGNFALDQVIITVIDVIDPVIEDEPDITDYIEGSGGNSITWTTTETNRDYYVIYLDDVIAVNTTWTGDITYNIDGLAYGSHNVTVVVYDIAGRSTLDQVQITVLDTTNPIIEDEPDISDYVEESTGNSITWSTTELNRDYYVIYLDDVVAVNTTWTGDITYNIDGLLLGGHNVTIVVYDLSGLTAKDEVIITVIDTTNPIVEDEPDISDYIEGSGGNSITWTTTETNRDYYVIYLDDVVAVNTTWTGDITYNIDGLAYGTHNVTVVVYDSSSNFAIDQVQITVLDTTNPVVEDEPDIPDYIEGSGGNSITWTTTELNRDYYVIYLDDVVAVNTTWTGDITYNIDGLLLGDHNVTVVVYDLSGLSAQDEVIITVIDTTNPVIEDEPDIPDYVEESTSNSITWTTTETNRDYYVIYLDDIVAVNTTWTGDITYNIDGLLLGEHNVTVVVYDTSGNSAQDQVIITVIDTTNPVIEDESDIGNYIEGSTGNSITWTTTETNRDYYVIYLDDVVAVNTTWTGDITYNIDGLLLGQHNVTVVVYDTSGNSAQDQVIITVNDGTLPIYNTVPANQTYEFGSTGHSVTWTTTEINREYYLVYIDGSLDQNTTWTGDITLNIDGLGLGDHNITIVIVDSGSNSAVDELRVTVVDTTDPIIENEPDIPDYIEGSNGNSITWTTTELNRDYYVIYLDDSIVLNTTWTGDISYNIDGLAFGSHNVTVVVYDTSSNSAQDQVLITVLDTTNPVIEDEPNIPDYIEGSTDNSIIWTTTELNKAYYLVYLDDVLQQNTTWTGDITLDIDGLALGQHNITVVIVDQSGLTAKDEVIVTVSDTTNPVFNSPPANATITEDVDGNKLVWNVEDVNPDHYVITIDGVPVANGSWSSPGNIEYPLDGLIQGVYIFEITINDTSGNTVSDVVEITVVDLTDPVIGNLPNFISYEEGTTGNNFTLISTDNHPDYYNISVIFNETYTLQIQNGTWLSGIDITVFIDGFDYRSEFYTIIISVTDEAGNTATDFITLEVFEITPPVIVVEPPSNISIFEGQNITLSWNVTDKYVGDYKVFLNNSFLPIAEGNWFNNTELTLIFEDYTKGTYSFEIVFRDQSFNSVTSIVIVTVIDNRAPTLDPNPNDSPFERGTTGNTITWNASDIYPNYYQITRNGTIIVNNAIWSNANNITLTVDGTPLGTYSYTIVVYDESGNFNSSTVVITFIDTIDPTLNSATPDFTFSEGQTGNQLQWNVTDATARNYTLYRNGQIIRDSNSWVSGQLIQLTIGNLVKGQYNYTIVISDGAGNTITATTIVTIVDDTAPGATESPEDTFGYIEGTTGHSLLWRMTDAHPNRIVLYRNGTQLLNQTWINNAVNTYDVSNLSFGVYNYTILVTDQSGNQYIDTVLVYVFDETLPEFTTEPSEIEYYETQTGYSLTWVADELHPSYYNLYINDDLDSTGNWESFVAIDFDIDGLSYGSYNFTLIIFDQSGNYISSSFYFDVQDNIAPVITVDQDDTTIELNQTDGKISWTATDLNPEFYILYIDGSTFQSRQWTSGNAITIAISGLDVGYYNITIEIYDLAGNTVVDTIELRMKDPNVTDTVRPQIELVTTVYEGDVEFINGTWIDVFDQPVPNGQVTVTLRLVDVVFTYQTTTLADGSYELLFNYTSLNPGLYSWSIRFDAEGYQSWENLRQQVSVEPHNYELSITVEPELRQGSDYNIAALLSYNNPNSGNLGSLSLSEFIPNQGYPEGVSVSFFIEFVFTDGTRGTLSPVEFSDENGVVSIRIQGSTTETIARIESISASIAGNARQNGAQVSLDPSSLPQIIEGNPGPIDQIVSFFIDNSAAIIAGATIFLILFGIIFVLRRRERQRIEELNQSIKLAQEEVRALESLKGIIVQTKSKLTLYEELLNRDDDMNTGLVGGMVSAFSTFLNEIGRNEADNMFGFETMERGDVSLTVHRGKQSNIIVISNSKLPFIMLSQIKAGQEKLEYEFQSFLQNTDRGVRKLKKDQLQPQLVAGGFKVDLLDELKLNLGNLRAVLRERTVSRAIKQNIQLLQELPGSRYAEDGKFFLTDLIDFFASRAINRRMSSRIIVAAYQFNVISRSD